MLVNSVESSFFFLNYELKYLNFLSNIMYENLNYSDHCWWNYVSTCWCVVWSGFAIYRCRRRFFVRGRGLLSLNPTMSHDDSTKNVLPSMSRVEVNCPIMPSRPIFFLRPAAVRILFCAAATWKPPYKKPLFLFSFFKYFSIFLRFFFLLLFFFFNHFFLFLLHIFCSFFLHIFCSFFN